MRREIVIFGAGGYARGTAEAAEAEDAFRISAFADQGGDVALFGRQVLSEQDILASGEILAGVVAIGDNWTRQQVVARIKIARPDFDFCRIIHPRAVISPSAIIGAGTVILAGSIVGANARLGSHVSVYTNAVIEHDSLLGDFASIAPGAVLGGTVTLGTRTFVGLGARVIHSTNVGSDVVIGAGATVVADTPDRAVMVGTPARTVGMRQPSDRYL